MSLLTEGRGGSYHTEPDGTLTYLPSGREPVLHVGSRRGVPYHSKTRYQLRGPRPPLPRCFGPEAVDALLAEDRPLDLRRDVWPLMAKEIGFGHYHELFHAHPGRTALPWPDFVAAYDGLDWYGDAMTALVATAVPDPADRLDFEALDHPLDGLAFPTPEAFQDHLRTHIARDVSRREDPEFSADLGAFLALLSLYGQLPRLVAAGRLTARSVAEQLDGWWQGSFSFLASGPPGFRLRQLLALSRAGVVRFLGAGIRIGSDETTGTFTATSPTVPGHTVRASALIEAYLPRASLDGTEDPPPARPAPGRRPHRGGHRRRHPHPPLRTARRLPHGRARPRPVRGRHASPPYRAGRPDQQPGRRRVRPPAHRRARVPPERRGSACPAVRPELAFPK